MAKRTVAERFWSNVDKDGPVPPHRPELGKCWIWTGTRQPRGYGRFHLDGRVETATRVAWSWAHGEPFPPGLLALHKCDNPPCVNPDHIFAGTQKENVRDAIEKGRAFLEGPRPQALCKRGHPLEGRNLIYLVGGRVRQCRTCKNAASRARKQRQRRECPGFPRHAFRVAGVKYATCVRCGFRDPKALAHPTTEEPTP